MARNYSSEWYTAYTSGEISYQEYADEHSRTGGQFPSPPLSFEERTDPFTAYLRTRGILGKTSHNPAERYQANLYSPLKQMYDIGQQQATLGMPGQAGQPRFTDFLKTMTGSTSNLPTMFNLAGGLLKNIFGATPEQYNQLGYEPGATLPEGGTENVYDPGAIGEMQDLMKYGLRTRYGAAGANWAASRLPELQGAYYGQRSAGQLAPTETWLNWLKSNYPQLAF